MTATDTVPTTPATAQPIASALTLRAARHDLATATPCARFNTDAVGIEIRAGAQSVWTILRWTTGHAVALRSAWCPASTLACTIVDVGADHLELDATSLIGRWRIHVTVSSDPRPYVRATASLRPDGDTLVDVWPRDVVAFAGGDEPGALRTDDVAGYVHAHQHGPRSGLAYASFDGPEAPSFLYFQNLTALNRFFASTRTSASDTVGGEWPQLGLEIPRSGQALPRDEEVIVSDAFLCPSRPDEHAVSRAGLFLDLLSSIYLHVPRPRTEFVDWPRLAQRAYDDVAKQGDDCWCTVARRRYLRAYVGDDKQVPESMVQLAVLLPLCEYQSWIGTELPLVRQLSSVLPSFWDAKRGSVLRWLPAAARRLDGKEPHLRAEVMDSWYVYHSLLNLSRLALRGDDVARKLFLDSLPSAINTAQHFGYRWPVFYDIDTLETLRAETSPGNGGEVDVAGMHAHVMLQAFDLTGDHQYLDEAITAVKALEGLRFDQCYQLNATAFTTGALVRLWKATGDRHYLDMSLEFIARVLLNVWIWDCNYGFGVHYPTFFCLCPLPDAPYASAYEELETAAALTDYLALMGEEAPTSVRILLPEMLRNLLAKGSSFFPAQLPDSMVAPQPATGHIDRSLWVPLEDMRDGWEPSGQVGQEVYGVAAAFEMVVRHYWRVDGEDMVVHCDYPIADFRSSPGRAAFDVLGDPRLQCRVRIINSTTGDSPPPDAVSVRLRLPGAAEWSAAHGTVTADGHREFECPGSVKVELAWRPLLDGPGA